jgi:hypothetical protein
VEKCRSKAPERVCAVGSLMSLSSKALAQLLLIASVTHLRLACEAFVAPCSSHATLCSARATPAVAALAAGRVEGSPSLQEYWAALPNATVDDEQLILKPDTYFLGQPSLGSSMFIRPVYSLLEEKIKEVWACGDIYTYVIGTPGE